MEQWIDKDIKIYKEIFTEHNEKEIAISHCALSMVKILNGLSEMNHTEFYKYEKQMLWNVMSLFSKQCTEQIYYALALDCKDTKQICEKKEIISDIENSISQMMEVCKNIFDGTANAERQMFQSLSVDTNIYELSPKLCAFYSSMLEKVVTLFTNNTREYAFVMHPTLNSTIEAKLLLETRKKSGKVVIIYISESSIENFNLVPICLMHEAFHVLTRQERHRKRRAFNFMSNMIEYIERSLFDNIRFSNIDSKDIYFKNHLMNFWFKDISKLAHEWRAEPEDSQKFYSKNIENELIHVIRTCLTKICIQLEETIFNFVCQEDQQKSYISLQEDIRIVTNITKQLRNNLNHIILGNKVSQAAHHLMFLFRETYADICCLLILHLRPDQYANAFLNSIQFDFDSTTYQDSNRWVREYLVAKTVSNFVPNYLHWNEYLSELEKQITCKQCKTPENTKNVPIYEEHSRQNNFNHDRMEHIVLSEKMYQQFHDYLTVCASDFNIRLDHINDIKSFRESVKAMITENSGKLLLDIFSENVTL